ncbi:PiggyBac transposable element-derived protein [Trichinella pseudospiralis]|uniref:PiggyBac transposable element-derived protein domain-containing protein n=1 Tax=Trichinella pseudospiralis TaxID=6337 RepID=A0A0V0YL63_TRIPS|nr:hypothetical protein T4E_4507 [Trichinella pseudospiralis]
MNPELTFHTTRFEPETESDEKDLLDLVPHESVTSDDCSEDDTPELQKKWEKRDLAVQNIAYKRRFESEERTLHFNDNSQTILDRDDPNYDQPFLEMFRKCCVETENEEMQCVDKQMIPYKGKHKLKQYLP